MNLHSLKGIFVCLLILTSISAAAQSKRQSYQGSEAKKIIGRAEKIILDEKDNPTYVRFEKGTKIKNANDLSRSIQLPSNSSFSKKAEQIDRLGITHQTYTQKYKGYEIIGSEYKVHSKTSLKTTANGKVFKQINITTTPNLTEKEAFAKALEAIDASEYIWENIQNENHLKKETNNPQASYFPKGKLSISRENYQEQSDFVLVYQFDIYAINPIGKYIVEVNAINGSIINKYNTLHNVGIGGTGQTLYDGVVNIDIDQIGTDYFLSEITRGSGVHTYDMMNGTSYGSANLFSETDDFFDDANSQAGVSAHFGAGATYDYFMSNFSRDSYDNSGAAINSYVHYSSGYFNAFWDGFRMTYGDGDGVNATALVSLDIVGHEIAHAVTEHSAGLIYSYESGALNESFSDIFGQSIEFENFPATASWNLADQIYTDGISMIRSMDDPNSQGQPDTYLGTLWYDGAGDNGGVHYNSGVQNFWYYLLVDGGTGTNDNGYVYNVNSIGLSDAQQIAYRNLTVYLTSNSEYVDARAGAELAAIDLFGEGSQQHMSVVEAWNAVGVPTATPTLSVPSTLDFGVAIQNNPFSLNLNISNTGNGLLTISDVSINTPHFTINETSFSIERGNTYALPIQFTPDELDDFTSTLTITSNAGIETVTLLGTGVEEPAFVLSESLLSFDLIAGNSTSTSVDIINNSDYDITFSVNPEFPTAPSPTIQYQTSGEKIQVGKNIEPLYKKITKTSLSGEDEVGFYNWKDSNEGVIYDWEEISITGTYVPLSDDSNSPLTAIGFDFPFYESSYNQLSISSNGYISFTNTTPSIWSEPLPSLNVPENVISIMASDLYPGSGSCYYYYDSTKNRFIIQYTNWTDYDSNTGNYTMQIQLYSNGKILLLYQNITNPIVATVAIQNETRSEGMTVSYFDAGFFTNQYAVEIGSSNTWLSTNVSTIDVPASSSASFDINADAVDLVAGNYEGELIIGIPHFESSLDTINVNLNVVGAPNIEVQDTLAFENTFVTYSKTDSIEVFNIGTDSLALEDIAFQLGDLFSSSETEIFIAPKSSVFLKINFSPIEVGEFTDSLIFSSNDLTQDIVKIYVSGSSSLPPNISINPDNIVEDLFSGESSTHQITVSNVEGGSDLFIRNSISFPSTNIESIALVPYDGPEVNIINSTEKITSQNLKGIRNSLNGINVLFFSDAGSSPVLNVLNRLDLGVTVYQNDYTSFINDLNNEEWDLVIFESYGSDFNIDLMVPYIENNGKLISSYWQYNAYPEFCAAMDATVSENTFVQNELYKWINHTIVTYPNQPLFPISPNGIDNMNDNGDFFEPINDAIAVLGVSANNETGKATTIIGNDDHTILNGLALIDYIGIDADNNSIDDIEELIENQISYLINGRRWLSIEIDEDTIPAGDNIDISVNIDTEGLIGGLYQANLKISNNDPDNPELIIPVSLNVTGAPNISLDSAILIGQVYVGDSISQDITISNTGTDELIISSVTILNSSEELTLSTSSLNILPGEDETIHISFEPEALGITQDTLQFLTNAPSDATLLVPVVGEAVSAPNISITPESLSEALYTNDLSVQNITIFNGEAAADLEFSMEIEPVQFPSLAENLRILKPKSMDVIDPESRNLIQDNLTSTMLMTDLSGKHIGSTNNSSFESDLEDRGATIINYSLPISEEQLNSLDVMLVDDLAGSFSTQDIDLIRAWVVEGNGLMLTGDQSVFNNNLLLSGSGIEVESWSYANPEFTDFISHSITDSVNSIFYPNGLSRNLISENAIGLVKSDDLTVFIAIGKLGSGYILSAGDEITSNLHSNDNRRFCNQSIDWLLGLGGLKWLNLGVENGTISGGDNLSIPVNFDATALNAGLYEANIKITSNDPVTNTVSIPVELNVTGIASLAFNDSTLLFPNISIGLNTNYEFEIRNDGNALLEISNIDIDNEKFTIDTNQLDILPGESYNLNVSYLPDEIRIDSATIVLTSNDHILPVQDFLAIGNGVEPPVIEVNPESLHQTLEAGAIAQQNLTIDNIEGNNDLIVNISIAPDPSSLYSGIKTVLLIKDYDPYSNSMTQIIQNHFGIIPDIIGSSEINDVNFNNYDLVITENAQGDTYYSRISSNVSKFDDFVFNGGTVFYAILDWETATRNLPNGVIAESGIYNYPHNIDLESKITDDYSDDMQIYSQSTFDNLPDNTETHTTGATTGAPTTITYQYGEGFVLASSIAVLEYFNYYSNGKDLLLNMIEYGISRPSASWLSTIDIDTIAAGEMHTHDVFFDASNLYAGTFDAIINIDSNDPNTPSIQVPTTLEVTGSPHIYVDESLSFESAYNDFSYTLTYEINNIGTDTLDINGVAIDESRFTTDLTIGEQIYPGRTNIYEAYFTSSSTGSFNGNLTIQSNDLNNSEVSIPLFGESAIKPTLDIAVNQIELDVVQGVLTEYELGIANPGEYDLEYQARVNHVETQSAILAKSKIGFWAEERSLVSTILPEIAYTNNFNTFNQGEVLDTLLNIPADIYGSAYVNDTLYFVTYESYFLYRYDVQTESIIDTLSLNGKSGNSNYGMTFDGEHLWIGEFNGNIYGYDLSGNFVGSLSSPYVDANAITYADGNLLVGRAFSNDDLYLIDFTGTIIEVISNDSFIYNLNYAGNGYIWVSEYSNHLLYDMYNMNDYNYIAYVNSDAYGYSSTYSNGKLYVPSIDNYFLQVLEAHVDGAIEGISLTTNRNGSIEPSGNSNVSLLVNTIASPGETLTFDIAVRSNDPSNSYSYIPATINVVDGEPNILLGSESIDFGQKHIEYEYTELLVLTNNGNDYLDVTDITFDNVDFEIDVTSFSLLPNESITLSVSYNPSSAGIDNTEMIISSNDFDNPSYSFIITAEGIGLPDITVTPEVLSDVLLVDMSSQHLLSINNSTGESLLTYDVIIEEGADFISILHPSGLVSPGQSANVTIDISSNGLNIGDYLGSINITSNDPVSPSTFVPVNLTVTAHETLTKNLDVEVCFGQSYFVEGDEQTESGTYYDSLHFSTYDSVYITHLTVLDIIEVDTATEICDGDFYVFGSQVISESGTFTEVFTALNGCDSTVNMTLHINPTYRETQTAEICEGATYSFGTQLLTESGLFTEVFSSTNGCDSTVFLSLEVHPAYEESFEAAICEGDSYVFGTQTLTLAGSYSESFISQSGCDSLVNLALVIHDNIEENLSAWICSGDTFVFDTQTLTLAGSYSASLTAQSGCDSLVNLTLTVMESYEENISSSICQDESFELGGQTLTTSGIYSETFITDQGCDSLVHLTLTVSELIEASFTENICLGETYLFGSQTLSSAGTYNETFTALNGCDSLVVLTLNVGELEESVSIDDKTLTADQNGASYQWVDCNNDNTPVFGAIAQSFTPTANGEYAVIITTDNCTTISNCVSVDLITTLDENHSNMVLDVFPIPTKGKVTIRLADNVLSGVYHIVDFSGRIVNTGSFENQQEVNIDILGSNGMYLMKIFDQNQHTTMIKILKK